MAQTKNPFEAVHALPCRFEFRTQARSAENLIFVLGDAFPAKKPGAIGTASHCFPQHMVVTALLCKVHHNLLKLTVS